MFLKNLYKQIAAASYKAKEQIVPLVLNENYSKKVIYMDNFTYNLISTPELIKKFNTGGINLVFNGSIMIDLITLPLNVEYNL